MLVVKPIPVTLVQRINTLSEPRSLQRQLASRSTPLHAGCQWCEGRRFAEALAPPALATPKTTASLFTDEIDRGKPVHTR